MLDHYACSKVDNKMALEFKWPIIIVFNELGPETIFAKHLRRILFLPILLQLNTCSNEAQIGVVLKLLLLDALT